MEEKSLKTIAKRIAKGKATNEEKLAFFRSMNGELNSFKAFLNTLPKK